MLVMCRSLSGEAIRSELRSMGETDSTKYDPMIIGDVYVVYGLLFLGQRVDYLISPCNGAPMWVPSSLFDVVDSSIPNGWMFCETKEAPEYSALFEYFRITHLIGYPLLVTEYRHYIGLLEGSHVELKRFSESNKI